MTDKSLVPVERINEHDRKLAQHGAAISVVVDEIKKLTSPLEKLKREIGF